VTFARCGCCGSYELWTVCDELLVLLSNAIVTVTTCPMLLLISPLVGPAYEPPAVDQVEPPTFDKDGLKLSDPGDICYISPLNWAGLLPNPFDLPTSNLQRLPATSYIYPIPLTSTSTIHHLFRCSPTPHSSTPIHFVYVGSSCWHQIECYDFRRAHRQVVLDVWC
jgi:hypothetical protein